jgi:hypothetical protein
MELVGHLAAQGYPGQVVLMSGSNPLYIQMTAAVAKMHGLRLAGLLLKPFRSHQVTSLLQELMREPGGITYRCFLLDDNRIAAIELIEAKTDADALEQARECLAKYPYGEFELWTGSRRVEAIDDE